MKLVKLPVKSAADVCKRLSVDLCLLATAHLSERAPSPIIIKQQIRHIVCVRNRIRDG